MGTFFNRCKAILQHTPHKVSFSDPQAWEDIYDRHDNKKPDFIRRPQSWLPSLPRTPSIFNTDGEEHESFRRCISPALSEASLQSYEPLIQSHVNSLISEIAKRTQPPNGLAILRMDSWLSFLTFDVMHHLCLGERSSCLETGRHQSWLDLRFKDTQWALLDMTDRLVPGHSKRWKSGPPTPLKEQAQTTFQTFHDAFHRCLSRNADPKNENFLTQLTKTLFLDNTVAQLEATFLAMQIKGSEAIATVLSGILYYLVQQYGQYKSLNHHTPFQFLVDEIHITFQLSSQISNDKLSNMPYLNATIKEGLRLCPPFPTTFTRYVPAGGAVVYGQSFATNTPVSINRFQISRSASNFSDPESFRPERWLYNTEKPNSSTEFPLHNEDSFHPFGLGSGKCPGSHFAYMMMRLTLAELLWHFDLWQAEPMRPWADKRSGVFHERGPWGVCLLLRLKEEWEEQRSKLGWSK